MAEIYHENIELHSNSKPIEYIINPTTNCHEVINRCNNSKGRPLVKRFGKSMYVSRYVAKLVYGEFGDDVHVLHKCDNGKCINPDHLFLGSNADNVKDKVSKNRQYKQKNISLSVVYEIKKNYENTAPELAKLFDVTPTMVLAIWKEVVYRYVQVENYDEIVEARRNRIESMSNYKISFTDDEVKTICDKSNSIKYLMDLFNCSESTINRYRRINSKGA